MLLLLTLAACANPFAPPITPTPPPPPLALADAPSAQPFCGELAAHVQRCAPITHDALVVYGAVSEYESYPELSRMHYVDACAGFAERRALYAACDPSADCRAYMRCLTPRINDANFDPATSPELCSAFATRGGDPAAATRCETDDPTRRLVGACMRLSAKDFPACAAGLAGGAPTHPPASPWRPRPPSPPLPNGPWDVATLPPDPVCEGFFERKGGECKVALRDAMLNAPEVPMDDTKPLPPRVRMTMHDACTLFPSQRDLLAPCVAASGCDDFARCVLRVDSASFFDPLQQPDLCEAAVRYGAPTALYASCKADPAVREQVGKCLREDRFAFPWCVAQLVK